MTERCPARAELGDIQVSWLDSRPHGTNVAEQHYDCDLENGHQGAHASLGELLVAGPKVRSQILLGELLGDPVGRCGAMGDAVLAQPPRVQGERLALRSAPSVLGG